MKLTMEEQELLLRCDREDETATCVIPAQGYGLWLNIFKRVADLVQTRTIFSGKEAVAYEIKFPKVWIRTPQPPRRKRGSAKNT